MKTTVWLNNENNDDNYDDDDDNDEDDGDNVAGKDTVGWLGPGHSRRLAGWGPGLDPVEGWTQLMSGGISLGRVSLFLGRAFQVLMIY